jgi:hypothetical protein
MNIVSIDFSINSPGICIYNTIDQNYIFVSYLKPKTGTKAEQKMQDDMSILEGCVMVKQPNFAAQTEFSEGELAKILKYKTISKDIINIILTHTRWEDPYLFAFEGSSYGSSAGTNNIIDMAAAAAILKLEIINTIGPMDIMTIAPSTIKKHAGKGNMKKDELWGKFLENCLNDPNLESHPIFEFVKTLGVCKKVPKPLDDLIDAYFLNHLVGSKLVQT